MKKILVLFSMILVLLLASSCARTQERQVFRFEAHQLEMKIGEEMKLELILGSVSPKEEIVYFADREGIVELNGNMCKAIANGVVKVTAQVVRIPTTKATVEITVTDEKLAGMTIQGRTSLKIGESSTLIIETNPYYIDDSVNWSSSDPKIATVDETGKVTAITPGIAIISAQSKYDETLIARKNVEVLYEKTEKIELEIVGGSSDIIIGQTVTIKATVYPQYANPNLTWSSGKADVASVKAGVVSALKVSNDPVKITVKSVDGKEASIEVKVIYPEATEVNITTTEDPVEVFEENQITLKATVLPAATNQTVTWESSDESIATVDSKGVVTGIKKGKVTITATSFDGKAHSSIEVTVTGRPDPESVEFYNRNALVTELTIELESSENVVVRIIPKDAKQDYIYIIGDEEIISINKTNAGMRVDGLSIGDTTITVKSSENEEIQAVLVIHIIPWEE